MRSETSVSLSTKLPQSSGSTAPVFRQPSEAGQSSSLPTHAAASKAGELWDGSLKAGGVRGNYLAIPLAIRLMSQHRPGCVWTDGGPDATCGDALREHHSDGSWLTSNP